MTNPYTDFRQVLFSCVDASPEQVVDFVVSVFNRPTKWSPTDDNGNPILEYHHTRTPLDFSLAYIDNPEPCNEPLRMVFWSPRNADDSTVFMCNHSDGMSFAVSKLSKESPNRWLNVRICDHVALQFPGVAFYYYDDHSSVQRHVVAQLDDSGWQFHQRGDPLFFESPSYYLRARIEDRLSRSIVAEYMKKLGYDLEGPDFWITDRAAFHVWQERTG